MLVQREGFQGPATQDTDWSITIGPEGKIDWSFQPTTHSRFGDRAGQKFTTAATLDKSWYTPNGEAIWQFADGTLVFVRSYKNAGAYRMSIALKQDGQNLACSVASTFARERGKDNITMNSAIDGAPVTIFSWKTLSSTCDCRSIKYEPGRRGSFAELSSLETEAFPCIRPHWGGHARLGACQRLPDQVALSGKHCPAIADHTAAFSTPAQQPRLPGTPVQENRAVESSGVARADDVET